MIIYISGPMTGLPKFNHDAFKEEQALQRMQGHTVLSPHKLPLGLEYNAYLDIAMAQVRASDKVVALPGWHESKGAAAEIYYAKAIGKEVEYLSR